MRSYLLFTAFTLFSLWSKSTTYYVNDASTTGDVYTTAIGNNANPGTSTQPFATLTFALTVATGSDIIIVDAGNYSDKDMVISSTQSGITIKGASITSTVFDGTPHTGIYNFMTLTGTNIHIESMTVTEYDNAGAIDITASSTLDSSRIYFKDIYFYRNETFTSFDSNPQGGALWISTSGANIPAAVYCDNCHFGDNLAEQGSGGGAIFITGKSTLIVKDSRFSCNNSRGILTTYEGGAIFFNQAHGKLRNTFISGSKVIDQQGGAIRTLNNTATTYNLDIYACTFTNNDARQGAGVYVEGKYNCTITNSLFYGNNITSGFGDGGTINCTNNGANQPTISIVNSTIANNNVVSGGDGAGLSNESAASYTVFNSIIWGNANFNVNATSTITATYCDIQPVGDMHTGVLGNINTNPLFTGGTDFTLQGTSPAINSGLLAGSPAKDLTGTNRSGNPDMGCFESGSINPTTSLVCTLFMNCSNPVITSSAPNLSICTGSTFSTSFVSSPVGATYVWSSPSVVGITGHSNNGTGDISEVLVNSTSAPLNVVYTITPYQGACIGTQISYTVTVNPQPTITSAAPVTSICSNTVFSTSLTSNTSSGITSYSWTSSTVAGITGHSTSGTGNISETLVNTTNGALNVSYTITPSVGSCNGTPVTYTVTVNPVSAVTSAAPVTSICSNTVFSTSLSANTSAGSTTYAWTSAAVGGITGHSTSGTGNISETLVNTTNGALNVSYTITPSFGGCAGTPITYTVTVNPVSAVTSAAPVTSICSNTVFSTTLSANTSAGSTTYAWTSSAVTGITGHSTSGTGNISETLVNTTNGALNVSYTITPSFGGCAGTPVTYTVTVNPVSTVISAAPVTSICSNTIFSTSLSANTSAGSTTYAWTSAAVGGITGHSTSGTGNISETLVNTTNGALNVSYTITPSFGGCAGTPITYTVTVNPSSAITSTAPATTICSNSDFITNFTSNTASGSTTYSWTSPAVSGITGHSTSGTGNISEILINTTNGPLVVTYTITPSFGVCAGTPTVYSVTVNPVSVITSAAPATSICSNTLFSTSLSANTSAGSTSYAWTSSAVTGITGHATSGTGNISETLVNTTNAPINVSYTIIPSFETCPGTPVTYTVAVNPVAAITSSAPVSSICSNTTFNTSLSANTSAGSTTYAWTSLAVTGITGHATSGTGNISETLVNTSNAPLVVTYTITPSFLSCVGTPTVYSVTVEPVATITSTAPASIICSGDIFTTALTSNTSAGSTSYSWTSSAVSGITGHATSGSGNISETLVNTTTGPLTVTYTILPSFNGCAGTPISYSVTVDMIQITMGATQEINCTNSTVTISGTSSTSGVDFSWTNSLGAPAGTTPTNSSTVVNAGGTYTLTITNPVSGCSVTGTVDVTVSSSVPDISMGADQELNCLVSNVTITGSTTVTNASFAWTDASSNAAGTTPNASSTNVSTAGIYTLTVTDLDNGCSITGNVNVTLNADPIAAAGNDTTLTCLVNAIVLDGSASSNGASFSYDWSGPSIVSGGTTTTPTIDEPGIYTITVTDANTGCVASESLEVFIDTVAPVANATTSQNIDCNNAQITIDGSGSTGNNLLYAWTGSGLVSGANTSSPIVNQGGNYILTITDSDNGCQDITTVNVVVDTLVPVFTAGNDTTVNCGQTLVTLTVNAISGATYNWTGNGIVSGGNSNSVTVNTAGTYSITITGANGCSATDAINVGFGTGPSASFTTDVNSGQVPLVVNTTNTSTGTDLTYEWDFGNGSTATTFNATTTYTTAGTYWIELIVTDSLGCKDTAMVEIDADKFPLDIPNGFTPNGDGINDVFQIVGIEQYPENKITIFNRWGELVFTAQPYTNNWDGISNNTQLRLTGDKVVDGTYYFVLELGEGLDTYHDYIELKSR